MKHAIVDNGGWHDTSGMYVGFHYWRNEVGIYGRVSIVLAEVGRRACRQLRLISLSLQPILHQQLRFYHCTNIKIRLISRQEQDSNRYL